MYSPFPKEMYYSACRIVTTFVHEHTQKRVPGVGTGIVISDANKFFVATARHNLEYEFLKRHASYSEINDARCFKVAEVKIDIWGMRADHLVGPNVDRSPNIRTTIVPVPLNLYTHNNSKIDLCVLELPDPREPIKAVFDAGFHAFNWTPIGVRYNDLARKLDYEETSPGESLIAFGYPEGSDEVQSLPISRSGSFASDPARHYQSTESDGSETFLAELFSTEGLSGAAVFALERVSVVSDVVLSDPRRSDTQHLSTKKTAGRRPYLAGFVAGHSHAKDNKIPIMHSNLTRCEKASELRELLDNVKNASGAIAQLQNTKAIIPIDGDTVV
jgi:hypothetical protein